jgi:hypothetical protein
MRAAAAVALVAPLAAIFALTPKAVSQDAPVVLPEIVRISYLEGDVRLERGKEKGPDPRGWAQARAGVPLESGYSLVTGHDGRAEIEFEDASTVYVAPDSALTFNQLSIMNSAPQTSITLLTGSISLNINASLPGERYALFTPKHNLGVLYPGRALMRIDSYLDEMDITPFAPLPTTVTEAGFSTAATSGHTLHYTDARRTPIVTPAAADTSGFEPWVEQRIQTRKAAEDRVMLDAGLTGLLPGIADLDQQGAFFPCAPYGTCWAPRSGWMSAHAASLVGTHWEEGEDAFPCWVSRYRDLVAIDPATHQRRVIYSDDATDNLYDWAVCHAGYWIHRDHPGGRGWVWVVGRHLHHHCPVRWVKYGGKTGFVPMHPRDETGKLPVNLKHGLFLAENRKAGSLEHVAFDPGKDSKALAATPKHFRAGPYVPLPVAAEPRLEARVASFHLRGMPQAPSTAHPAAQPAMLTFNAKSQTFMLAHQVDRDGHATSVVEPFGGRVDRGGSDRGAGSSGSSFGGSGSRTVSGGSESRGGYSGGSSSFRGGGESHGGGYSGGSSGGGHMSSGSSAPAASSAPSSAGSSAGASSASASHR